LSPLEGIKVLDLSRVLAGPWCTQLLADLGAEVLKVERPFVGDDTRHWGPPWHGEGDKRVAAYFLSCNRGKRSAAIDFAQTEGAALVRDLAARADVVVENFKVGGLEKFGLGAASLRSDNPRLVYASITGFGQDGPYADRAGYDFMIQAMGGLMSITGLPDGQPGGGPMRVGVAVADLFTGMYTAVAILAALYRREKTGEGSHVDMALLDTQLAVLANQVSNFLVSGDDPPRQGNTHPNLVPYQPFEASDRPLVIAVGNERQFARLAEIAGHPEWVADERFATNAARVANRAESCGLSPRPFRSGPPIIGSSGSRAPEFLPGRSMASVRPSKTSRLSIAKWSGRSQACRWSVHRCASMAPARTRIFLRPRWASIPRKCCTISAWTGSRSTACTRRES